MEGVRVEDAPRDPTKGAPTALLGPRVLEFKVVVMGDVLRPKVTRTLTLALALALTLIRILTLSGDGGCRETL